MYIRTSEIEFDKLVAHDYMHDPEKEFIATSAQLQEGMRVLSCRRKNLAEMKAKEKIHYTEVKWLIKTNRWFTISNIHYFNGQMGYTATYDDGTVEVHAEPVHTSWVVKRDSLKPWDEKKSILRSAIVNYAMDPDNYRIEKIDDMVARVLSILDIKI